MRGLEGMRDDVIAPLELNASGADFDYALRLDADRALVLQGDAWLQPEIGARTGLLLLQPALFQGQRPRHIDDKPVEVAGQAWMDREWSSQPLASDQTGWDWLSLHLTSGEKLMLYRMRQTDGNHYASGNWISPDGNTRADCLGRYQHDAESPTPRSAGASLPTTWEIAIPMLGTHNPMRPAEREELDEHQLSLLGGADRLFG